jgi:hypothetical protein
MAHLQINDGKVRLNLSRMEKIGALHSSPEAKLSDIESVEVVENPWSSEYLKGVRAPGTGIPFRVLLGTMKYRGGNDFCANYRRTPSAIITMKTGPFKRWIFAIKDMGEIKALEALI